MKTIFLKTPWAGIILVIAGVITSLGLFGVNQLDGHTLILAGITQVALSGAQNAKEAKDTAKEARDQSQETSGEMQKLTNGGLHNSITTANQPVQSSLNRIEKKLDDNNNGENPLGPVTMGK